MKNFVTRLVNFMVDEVEVFGRKIENLGKKFQTWSTNYHKIHSTKGRIESKIAKLNFTTPLSVVAELESKGANLDTPIDFTTLDYDTAHKLDIEKQIRLAQIISTQNPKNVEEAVEIVKAKVVSDEAFQ